MELSIEHLLPVVGHLALRTVPCSRHSRPYGMIVVETNTEGLSNCLKQEWLSQDRNPSKVANIHFYYLICKEIWMQ